MLVVQSRILCDFFHALVMGELVPIYFVTEAKLDFGAHSGF